MIQGLKMIEVRCTTCEHHRWFSTMCCGPELTIDICAKDIPFELPMDGVDIDSPTISDDLSDKITDWWSEHRVSDVTVCPNWWGPKVVK